MAVNAAETLVLSDCSHIKSCPSKSTQFSPISGLTSAFWGHPVTTATRSRRDMKKEQFQMRNIGNLVQEEVTLMHMTNANRRVFPQQTQLKMQKGEQLIQENNLKYFIYVILIFLELMAVLESGLRNGK